MAVSTGAGAQSGAEMFSSEQAQRNELHERLRSIGTLIEVPRNDQLYRAGDVPDSCYLVQSGRIVSTKTTAAGRELVFSSNEEGAVILLPAIILRRSLTMNFKASVPSRLVRVRREDLFRAMAADPGFLADMLYDMTAKYSDLLDMFQSTSHTVPWKVCNLLLSLAEKHGVDYDGKILIKKKYSQQMMADFLHANRTTIARVIKELSGLGLVERINDYYCIRSVEKLQRHMEDMENSEG